MYKQKISAEEKINVVEAYESGEIGYKEAIAAYRIHASTFQAWVRNYRALGREGLLEKRSQRDYPPELRKAAVEEYLKGGCSQADICRKYKICSRTQLMNWIKQYWPYGRILGNSEMRNVLSQAF